MSHPSSKLVTPWTKFPKKKKKRTAGPGCPPSDLSYMFSNKHTCSYANRASSLQTEAWLATHTSRSPGRFYVGDPQAVPVMNKRHLIYAMSVNMQANPVWLLDKSMPPASLLSLHFCSCCSAKMTFPVLPSFPLSESSSLQVSFPCLLLRGANSSDPLPWFYLFLSEATCYFSFVL